MNNRRQALSRARQYRTCPPRIVAQDRHSADKVKRHMAVCPYCSGQEKGMPDPWEKLAARISRPEIQQPAKKNTVSVGRFHYVKPERACWRGDYYYNPPLVLVMAVSPDMADAIQVAQTYHELCMAGPGDLILYNDQTGCGDLFVECWHTYTLQVDDLGPPVGKVSDEVLQAVFDAGENKNNMPDWVPLTLPMTDQDPRIYFRELEVECGFVFSEPSVDGLLRQIEKPGICLSYPASEDLQADLVSKTPGLHWHAKPETVEQVLALARYPDEMLPLAAATADIPRFPVNLVYIHKGRVKRSCPLIAEILLKQETKSRITISGRIMDLPNDVHKSDLLVFWPDYAGRPLQPFTLNWNPSGADFFITFAQVRRRSDTWADTPAMALVCDSGKGK